MKYIASESNNRNRGINEWRRRKRDKGDIKEVFNKKNSNKKRSRGEVVWNYG